MKLHFANVPQFCASIKLTEEKPLIDLTALDFIEPSALVYLGVFLRHFNSAGKYFRVNPPTDHKVRKSRAAPSRSSAHISGRKMSANSPMRSKVP